MRFNAEHTLIVWIAFLVTSVYGHVALKLAMQNAKPDKWPAWVAGALNPWGVTALISWTLSALLWMMVLRETGLHRANTVATVRFLLISFSAWLFLKEPMGTAQWVGAGFVAVGVFLVTRG